MDRRRYLISLGALAAIAGCSDNTEDEGEPEADGQEPQPGPEDDEVVEPDEQNGDSETDDGDSSGEEDSGTEAGDSGTEDGESAESTGEEEKEDETDESGTAELELVGLTPGNTTVDYGQTVDVAVTVANNTTRQRSIHLELRVAGELREELAYRIQAEDETDISATIGTESLDVGEYEYGFYADDFEITATLAVSVLEPQALRDAKDRITEGLDSFRDESQSNTILDAGYREFDWKLPVGKMRKADTLLEEAANSFATDRHREKFKPVVERKFEETELIREIARNQRDITRLFDNLEDAADSVAEGNDVTFSLQNIGADRTDIEEEIQQIPELYEELAAVDSWEPQSANYEEKIAQLEDVVAASQTLQDELKRYQRALDRLDDVPSAPDDDDLPDINAAIGNFTLAKQNIEQIDTHDSLDVVFDGVVTSIEDSIAEAETLREQAG